MTPHWMGFAGFPDYFKSSHARRGNPPLAGVKLDARETGFERSNFGFERSNLV